MRAHLGIAALDDAQRLRILTADEAPTLASAEAHAAQLAGAQPQ